LSVVLPLRINYPSHCESFLSIGPQGSCTAASWQGGRMYPTSWCCQSWSTLWWLYIASYDYLLSRDT